ncbi:MAG: DUF5618 family protein [Bacteroidia bacterium]|nr:DUF5618 family protein [Bacteroidia bacterium]
MKHKKEKIENPYNYLENAREILKEKAKKNGEFYTYRKYVKMAGHTAWPGVLLALDHLMDKHHIKIKGRKDVNDYRTFIASINKKMLNYFNSAYEYLHLFMGYDGNLDIITSKHGLDLAQKLIDWVNTQVEFNKE